MALSRQRYLGRSFSQPWKNVLTTPGSAEQLVQQDAENSFNKVCLLSIHCFDKININQVADRVFIKLMDQLSVEIEFASCLFLVCDTSFTILQ